MPDSKTNNASKNLSPIKIFLIAGSVIFFIIFATVILVSFKFLTILVFQEIKLNQVCTLQLIK